MTHKPWRKRFAYLLMERRNLSNAALLHATSVAEGQTLKSYGFDTEIVILPNGVDVWQGDPPSRRTFRRRLGLDGNAKLVVYLGRIHPIKRLDILASALEQILKVAPNTHLVIAGPDECGYRKALEPMFARAGEKVHWVGEVGQLDKWALLRDADVLVACSDSESFGMSVVEAMAVGVPVVATKTCPWREVETAGCGFWVAQDSGEIAKAVRYVLSHPVEAEAMGERGKALARTKYSWDSIARRMADCYATAVGARLRVA